ncbi:MFS general substrate transporter [Mollisia scopiformis]|uniref:MFS general substrate transporter n=1 Tax=Mollisia scopiformis TaxID=149040 RepID=A0A194X6Y5_MOLSC|nr:MFS general substrate transporter [Mollisia scopiformis]KUJ15938.1 MFS general substrate transporter [Mollisia scopiformis]
MASKEISTATSGDPGTPGEKVHAFGLVSLDSEPVDDIDPKEERAFVWRLDLFFLTIGSLGYTFKYLDQTNISNAYVSDMKEDLSLYGNQLNYFTTYFNIGYMVMWGILTCCLSTVDNYEQGRNVYGLRFLIGFFESCTWPGYFTIISQWYLPHEMALRMSIYNIAQPVGAMLSGALQGALSTNLDGSLGRSGWRWAFIINGVCTIFIALVAFFILPGFLGLEIALARSCRVGRKPQVGITPKTFFRAFTFWQLWAFAIGWAFGGNTTPTSYFNLSVPMLNYLPIVGQAIALVCELLFSGFSDYFGSRLPFLLLHAAINISSLVILVIRPSNQHTYMAGWYMNYIGSVSTMLICAWASTYHEDEPEVRTVFFATGIIMSYLQSAFLPIAAYPASEAPHWRIGAKLYLAFVVMAVFIFVGTWFGLRWQERKKAEDKIQEDVVVEKAGQKSRTNTVVRFQGDLQEKA